MKTPVNTLIPALILLFFSCTQLGDNKTVIPVLKDTTQINIDKKEQARMEKGRQMEKNEREDSLQMNKVLEGALEIARQNIGSDNFFTQYDQLVDSSFESAINLTIGHLFSKTKKHLIIRITAPWAVFLNIYLINGKAFRSVINHKQSTMIYTSDSIRDINGDDHKDFIVNWYGSSGCCLKGFSNVYLYKEAEGTFTSDYEFINPTFSPKEGIIRGVCYGHPGETEMYKYKWNGEKIDTIAYIYYEKNDSGAKTGKVIKSDRLPYEKERASIKILNSVPKEFTRIYGYDWFTGNWN